MKLPAAIFAIFVIFSSGFAQERVLLTPSGEAIPVVKGQSAFQLAKKTAGLEKQSESILPPCPTEVAVGKHAGNVNTNFGFFNGDVACMVYQAPVTGVIESVYFESFGTVANPDSTALVRIMRATTSGFATGATRMGAWPDTNTIASGDTTLRTPYEDEATGPFMCDSGSHHCFAPVGTPELWGLGGFPVTWHTGQRITGVAMFDLGYEPTVMAGDSFCVCIRIPPIPETGTLRNEMSADNNVVTPFRFHKYYHHNRSTAGTWGWWAREFDMFIWVVMRLSPASITFPPAALGNTFSTNPRAVSITGCGRPGFGLSSAFIFYRVLPGGYSQVPMVFADTEWVGYIPGQSSGTQVFYYVREVDSSGTVFRYPPSYDFSYLVLGYVQSGYQITLPSYNFIDITTSGGTQINPSNFFPNNDDGTAGPFDLGGTFRFFSQNLMYSWVGVNGAICLSASPTDTINVNANGFFANWTIPQPNIARNFIATFWNDLYLAPGGHGTAWYRTSGSQFIVEWFHIGNFISPTDTSTTFEVILDRTDSSITFQYADVGTSGLDSTELVGLQELPTNPPSAWVFINRFGYPIEMRPTAGFAIKMKLMEPTGVGEPDRGLLTQFALYPNFPNPFNPATMIRYDLPKAAKVSLRVYNILGQGVATLVNGEQKAGRYEVEFKGEGLASGVYFYRLAAGDFVDVKKLLLLK